MRKQKSLIVLLVGGFLIFTAAAFIFTKYYASRPIQPTPLPATQTVASSPALSTPVSGGFEASANPEIPRVSLEDAKAAFDSRSAVFIDVRGSAAFAFSHIPGALDIPLSEIETRLTELDPSQWIITYCTWLNEHTSAGAARILLDHGFKKVNPILGGFNAWEKAGYPVEP